MRLCECGVLVARTPAPLELAGDHHAAAERFRHTAALAPNQAERHYLGAKASACAVAADD